MRIIQHQATQGSVGSTPRLLMPLTTAVALTLVSLDFFGWTTGGPSWRYGPVLLGLVLAVGFDLQGSLSLRAPRAYFLALLSITYSAWLLVLVCAAAVEGAWSTDTLVVAAVPLLIGAMGVMQLLRLGDGKRVSSIGAETVAYIGAGLFALLCLIEVLMTNKTGPLVLLSHEKAFIAIFIFCMPRRKGASGVKFLMAAAMVGSLIAYPSATTVATLFSAALIFLLVRKRRSGFEVSVVVFGVPLIAFALMEPLERALSGFYSAVGRTDNTQTRLFLWKQAVPYIQEDPLVGGAARVSITALANINGVFRPTPLHNSFLTLGLVGGAISVVLLCVLLVTMVGTAMQLSDPTSQVFVQQWMPALVAGLTTFAVNPVIDSLGSALFFYAIICVGLANTTRTTFRPVASGIATVAPNDGGAAVASTFSRNTKVSPRRRRQ
ncbi:O-antigen ligase family protein [Pseudarthrobacter sp. L1SW]|uniref:O-antigen ligase family protein n=1 Tax=Pseudarthrobacter sp. L1SW TaxID=2851598 RepID=UPI001E491B4C|nr:O-antigen ligase family protein [Pseudarthrobacter sp. L1SW]UEL27783.1 O-antigen ligase family protein [Pseudarthrobacter sp. L1SW]